MVLTEKQKQEVLKILEDNTERGSSNIAFSKDVLVAQSFSDINTLTFSSSCTVPYIKNLSNFNIEVLDGVSVEFPSVVSMETLHLHPSSSVLAPELLKLEHKLNSNTAVYYSLSVDVDAKLYIPKLISIKSLFIAGNRELDDFNIQKCGRLTLASSTQFATKTLTHITIVLSLMQDSTVIFLEAPERIGKVRSYARVSTIIAPESSSKIFKNLPHGVELILISEED